MPLVPSLQVQPGLTAEVVEAISRSKDEPPWMLQFRLDALQHYLARPLPAIAGLSDLDFDAISYLPPPDPVAQAAEEVPAYIKETFDRLGIPESQRHYPAAVRAQGDADAAYESLRQDLAGQGVIFLETGAALREHPDLVRQYFGTQVPASDGKLAALNGAVWNGGTFVYVPAGVRIEVPLQTAFRGNAGAAGRFERTLIVAEEGSEVHFIEGCTAPTYTASSLRSAAVEIIAGRGSRVRYTALQNWSHNVYNAVAKRAAVYQDAAVEWIDCNLGGRLTIKHPSVHLLEPGARGDILTLTFAGDGQQQHAGATAVHAAPNTTSFILSRSVSRGAGRAAYHPGVKIHPDATGATSSIHADALLLDAGSCYRACPAVDVEAAPSTVTNQASVTRLDPDRLFYLRTRGLPESAAAALLVNAFAHPISQKLPMEYAVELARLITAFLTS